MTLPFVGLAALKTPILNHPISAGISPSDPVFSLQAFELFAADRPKVFNWGKPITRKRVGEIAQTNDTYVSGTTRSATGLEPGLTEPP